jgi:hypothetical protein
MYIYYIVQEHLQNDSRRSFAKIKKKTVFSLILSDSIFTNISWEPPTRLAGTALGPAACEKTRASRNSQL